MKISAIICTHNPRPEYLRRTLNALEKQTLSRDEWELLMIDNASREELSGRYPVDWHIHAKWVREDELGLTAARMRGVKEARGELLVFVDDDNILAPSYLKSALEIAQEYPWLGAFGAARIVAEYEEQPASEVAPYLYMLALRNEDRDLFGNLQTISEGTPYGAGICVRSEVGRELARRKEGGGIVFGRKGEDLFSSEDLEISLIASDCGFGYGIFRRLSITHLIPAERVRILYLLRMAEGQSYSNNLLKRLRDRELGQPARSFARDLITVANVLFRTVTSRGIRRQFEWKSGCGNLKALRHFRRITKACDRQDANLA
jgi:glycosyltransferase involved in cell wall biosynthesis